MPKHVHAPRFHRGWAVTAGCFLIAIFAWGTVFYGHGFYISSLTRLHGWSTSAVSGAVTLFWVVGIPMTVITGGMIDRFGPRAVMAAGGTLVGISVLLLGQASELWHIYAAFVVMALGYPAVGAVGISATLGPWFDRNLGMAMSFALTGASVGAMVMVPVVTRIAVAEGFTFAATAAGLSIIIVTLPVAALVIARPPGAAEKAASATPALRHLGTTARIPAFWVIVLATGLSLAAQVGFLSHQIPVLEERLTRTAAADAVAVTAAAGIIGRFGLGFFAARFDLRWIAGVSYGVQALGLVAIAEAPPGLALYGACALSGFVVGCLVILPPLLARRWFGAAGYGKTYGLLALFLYLFQAMGPGMSGVIRDAAGSYGPALWTQSGILIVAIFVISRLSAPPPE
ncbi:MAG: MFS transporter [Minwuia sp.]|nr:MFS transporter [Minwuia sp.]